MERTTSGTFRVHPGRRAGELLLVERGTADPTYVPREGVAADLEPGNRVRATLAWRDGEPRVADATVEAPTRYRFYRTEEPIFEAARECWTAARAAAEPMNARVTRDTDGTINGVVYAFAAQPGQRDLFAEFRDGAKPLDPLLDRVVEGDADAAPPFAVFVIDPDDEPFVVVTIALDPDGLFARTVRETYGDVSLADVGDLDGGAGIDLDPTDDGDRFEFDG